MITTNLSEFSVEQLNTYLTMCDDSIETFTTKLKMVKDKISKGPIYTELTDEYNQKLSAINLLRVQIMNARIVVIKNDIVNQN